MTSGAYAYVANPMQLSMTVILLGLGGILRSPYLALLAIVATMYGSGIAAWHEKVTVADRFGKLVRIPLERPGMDAAAVRARSRHRCPQR